MSADLDSQRRPAAWRISAPRRSEAGGVSRVQASVAGTEVWFESPDGRLEPAAEAFASALLIQSLECGAELAVDAPLDAAWLANTRELLPIFHRWWGYPERHPVRDPKESPRPAAFADRPKGLFFSGGVDSFHSLLHLDDGIGCLVFVHGVDIPLDDAARAAACERSVREIARRSGKRAIVVRTNLREHPLFEPPRMTQTHGGFLAAVAHVLGGELSSVLVSSSFRYEKGIPWGSHWDTDPFWSSTRVALRHGDATLGHHQKLLEIAREPLVAEHLRVCNKAVGLGGNCSRCEKCLRTMVSLEVAGALDRFAGFDHSRPLAARIDRVEWLQGQIVPIWAEFLDMPISDATAAAIRGLLARNERLRARRRRIRRLRRRWQHVLGALRPA